MLSNNNNIITLLNNCWI